MDNEEKKICKDYKSIMCVYCTRNRREECCLSLPVYQKRHEQWVNRMHEKAKSIHELDLQIAKLYEQRRGILDKLSSKDFDRVMIYLRSKPISLE